ncbi:DUF6134 family protein [Emcibacter sp. SYSU 3D8]|uniref:DUF6134 family protein n=1 Tax=Emcibacter sp. SYSU 3D8 TaxID=3133969 RepID=UPI0031FE9C9C
MRLRTSIATTLIAATMAVAAPSTTANLGPATAGAGVPQHGKIEFAVFRKGTQIGTHKIGFQAKGGRLQVEVDADLKVQMLFVTVYRYRHEATEHWAGDRMVAFESATKQNGKQWVVDAHVAGEDKLLVKTNDQQRMLPDTLPPTSYWKPDMMATSRWFNTQYGSPIDVNIAPMGIEQVESVGATVTAHRYKVTGVVAETGKPIDLDLWYGENGELVKMQFIAVADGSLIDFSRTS